MNWSDLLAACALYLVLEGLLPFASPKTWRKGLFMMSQLSDAQLRVFGAVVVFAGLVMLVWVRG